MINEQDHAVQPSAGLIDVHAHFLTDDYVRAATAAGHPDAEGMPGWPEWTPAGHLALMDEQRIDRAILSLSSPGPHFGDDDAARTLARSVNEYAASVRRDHPTRFGHFAALPLPDVAGALDELSYALDVLGSEGIAVETNTHGHYLGDELFDPLWAELDRRGATVLVHPTSPPQSDAVNLGRPDPMLEFMFDSTRAVSDLIFSRLLLRHPNITWIFTHCGGPLPLLADRMEMFRPSLPGTQPDDPTVNDQVRRLWFDMAGNPFPNWIPALTKAFGTDHLLYGSDYCWTPARATAAQINSIDTAEPAPGGDTWRTLTTRNAHRLFPSLDH